MDIGGITLVVSALRGPGAHAGSGGEGASELGQTSELQGFHYAEVLVAAHCERVPSFLSLTVDTASHTDPALLL